MSQQELADKVILSEGMISYIESNERTPRVESLRLIAKVLNVKVDDLLRD